MALTAINNLPQILEVQQRLRDRDSFSLSVSGGDLSVEPGPGDRLRNAEILLDMAESCLRGTDLRQINLLARTSIKILATVAYRAAVRESTLASRAISVKLGCQVAPSDLNGDYLRFIKANHFQNKFQALDLQVQGQSLPIEMAGRMLHIPWSSLTQIQTEEGIAFQRNGVTLFTTDENLVLNPNFTVLHRGITAYNPMDFSVEPRPFYHQDPNEWGGGPRLEVCVALVDPTGETMQPIMGDHTYFRLKDASGEVFSFGQMPADITPWDMFNPLAEKMGGLESPDRYETLSPDSHLFKTYPLNLTPEQYERVKERVLRDRADPDFKVSLLKGNCTSYVKRLLKEELGMHVNCRMGIAEYLSRLLLPKAWFKGVQSAFSGLSKTAVKALHFIVLPYYAMNTVIALVLKVFMFEKLLGNHPDFTLIDIFFKPWKVGVHSPFKFYEAMGVLHHD
ncbi:MAG: hypothetical protein SP1CHLAM54_06650 [Chlamydiia bacterium]|nr:hypothetical protein [Chlamydiia bacterium]MCH9615574.1 hypothetical protein [Chlamydiia bacterium]MCH9629229.1 hypothetical protein [Chlamydiia bacterium]